MRVISLPLWLPLNAKWRVPYDQVSDHRRLCAGVRVHPVPASLAHGVDRRQGAALPVPR